MYAMFHVLNLFVDVFSKKLTCLAAVPVKARAGTFTVPGPRGTLLRLHTSSVLTRLAATLVVDA